MRVNISGGGHFLEGKEVISHSVTVLKVFTVRSLPFFEEFGNSFFGLFGG